MPGPVVHFGAVVQCLHGGIATPLAPNPRVSVSAQPIVTIASPYGIAGCSLTPSGVFCATGQWLSGAARVTSLGVPLAVQAGASVCATTGMPMLAVSVQPRVVAT
jgi:hypothetical protein